MKNLIIVLFFAMYSSILSAQCGKELRLEAEKELDDNALIIDEFKVHLNRLDSSGMAPIAHYPMDFEKNKTYQFAIAWDDTIYKSRAILQLVHNGALKGSNHQAVKDKMFHSFSFFCPLKSQGEILVYFENSYGGCATVLVSEIIKKED